jgi:hypothetical protein
MNVNEQPVDRWEARFRTTASALPYPPTPDVAGAVRRRLAAESARPAPRAFVTRRPRLAWAIAVVVLLVAGLLAVPEVRAGLLQFLQVGAVRIFLVAPSPTPSEAEVIVTALPGTGTLAPTATPPPTPPPVSSLLDLAGETTLEDARARFGFPIALPAYPSGLGPPDRVFLQDFGGPMVVLVWLDPAQPDRVRLSLHLLTCDVCATKGEPPVILTMSVNGQPAVWTEGPYMLQLSNGELDLRRMIEGHVLIWAEGPITYRLETDLSLDEAVKIAESLR